MLYAGDLKRKQALSKPEISQLHLTKPGLLPHSPRYGTAQERGKNSA